MARQAWRPALPGNPREKKGDAHARWKEGSASWEAPESLGTALTSARKAPSGGGCRYTEIFSSLRGETRARRE